MVTNFKSVIIIFDDNTYDLLTGMVFFGNRKHGRPKMRFEDNSKNTTGISIARVVREAEDRENWRIFCGVVSTI